MIWLAALEGVAICVLGLFVVALAHSYAGLAARIESDEARPGVEPSGAEIALRPRHGTSSSTVVRDIDGVTTDGETVLLPLAGAASDTLLAFMTSSCTSCQRLWEELPGVLSSGLLAGVRLIVVAKGPERESPAAIKQLSDRLVGVDVVMSSSAWIEFEVPGSPFFVLVDHADGGARGQGTALRWQQVVDLMGLAGGDETLAARPKSRRDRRHELDVDHVLMSAGVFPGDPSLYPVDRTAPLD